MSSDFPWEPPVAGHADLLRESVDGLTGEDPPAGWKPRGTPPVDAQP